MIIIDYYIACIVIFCESIGFLLLFPYLNFDVEKYVLWIKILKWLHFINFF